MKEIEKIKNCTNPKVKILLLQEAIRAKIQQLNDDLKTYPTFFFMLPGVASITDKLNKIKALSNLQFRLEFPNTPPQDKGLAYTNDTLDGDTLTLFQLANELSAQRFTDDEDTNLTNRNPGLRLLRF